MLLIYAIAFDSDINLNCAGEGQFASSYGQGGGLGRRDENDYRVELTPGWRLCRNNKQFYLFYAELPTCKSKIQMYIPAS